MSPAVELGAPAADESAAHGALRERRLLANALLAAGLMLAAVLVVFPPERYGIYPVCPVRQWLHVECPGCGATRALAALLRGRFAEAWRLNALFVSLLPAGVGMAVKCYWQAVRVGKFYWPKAPRWAMYGGLGMAAGFMVVRNVWG